MSENNSVIKIADLEASHEKAKKVKKIKEKIELKEIEESLKKPKQKTVKLPTVKVVLNKKENEQIEQIPIDENGQYVFTEYQSSAKNLLYNSLNSLTFKSNDYVNDLVKSRDLNVSLSSFLDVVNVTNPMLGGLLTIASISMKHAVTHLLQQKQSANDDAKASEIINNDQIN